jgi:hypothetical protein
MGSGAVIYVPSFINARVSSTASIVFEAYFVIHTKGSFVSCIPMCLCMLILFHGLPQNFILESSTDIDQAEFW